MVFPVSKRCYGCKHSDRWKNHWQKNGVWVPNEGDTEPANSMDLENGYLVQNLEGITKKDYTIIASGKTAAGSRWGNAIRLKGKGSYVQCNTNGEYRMLSGVFGPSSQFAQLPFLQE